jgi:hypothetical protein
VDTHSDFDWPETYLRVRIQNCWLPNAITIIKSPDYKWTFNQSIPRMKLIHTYNCQPTRFESNGCSNSGIEFRRPAAGLGNYKLRTFEACQRSKSQILRRVVWCARFSCRDFDFHKVDLFVVLRVIRSKWKSVRGFNLYIPTQITFHGTGNHLLPNLVR